MQKKFASSQKAAGRTHSKARQLRQESILYPTAFPRRSKNTKTNSPLVLAPVEEAVPQMHSALKTSTKSLRQPPPAILARNRERVSVRVIAAATAPRGGPDEDWRRGESRRLSPWIMRGPRKRRSPHGDQWRTEPAASQTNGVTKRRYMGGPRHM